MAVRTLRRRELLAILPGAVMRAQAPVEWVCPMDPDVRSTQPGRCRKCGMQLTAGIPEPEEYPVDMTVRPPAPHPGQEITLRFRVNSPHGHPAKLQLMHEKLFHLFLVSKDLSVFRHEHPEMQADGSLLHHTVLPKGGMYRVL